MGVRSGACGGFVAGDEFLFGDIVVAAEAMKQQSKQVVGQRAQVGLYLLGVASVGPGLGQMQFAFAGVEGLFDFPSRQSKGVGPEWHLVKGCRRHFCRREADTRMRWRGLVSS